jgi:hypothetical protein
MPVNVLPMGAVGIGRGEAWYDPKEEGYDLPFKFCGYIKIRYSSKRDGDSAERED